MFIGSSPLIFFTYFIPICIEKKSVLCRLVQKYCNISSISMALNKLRLKYLQTQYYKYSGFCLSRNKLRKSCLLFCVELDHKLSIWIKNNMFSIKYKWHSTKSNTSAHYLQKNSSTPPHPPNRFYFIKSTNQYCFDELILYLIDL